MFNLYYLADQTDDINGAKTLQGTFASIALAQAQATLDGILHYSIEQDQGSGTLFSIVLIT